MKKFLDLIKKVPLYAYLLVLVIALAIGGAITDMVLSQNSTGLYSRPFTVPAYQENGELSDDYRTFVFVNSNIEDTKTRIHSIWLNLAEIPEGRIETGEQVATFSIMTATHDLTTTTGNIAYGLGRKKYPVSSVIRGHWFCVSVLTNNVVKQKAFVNIIFDNGVSVNEIAIVGEKISDGSLVRLTPEVVSAGMVPYSSDDDTTEELSSVESGYRVLSDSLKDLAVNLTDNQGSFDVSTVREMGDTYQYTGTDVDDASISAKSQDALLTNATGLIHGESYYLYDNANVFMTEITALGILIFGNNMVGLKLIPLLILIGGIIVVFTILKSFFKKISLNYHELFAVLGAFIYAGIILSLAIFIGAWYLPMVSLFIALSVFFMLKYFYDGVNYDKPYKTYLSVILSGLFFSLAFLTKVTAIITLIPIIALFVIKMVKDAKFFNAKLPTLSEEKQASVKAVYKNSFIGLILSAVLGFVLVFIVCLMGLSLISGKIICNFYGIEGMIEAIFRHTGVMFTNWL